MSSHAKADTLEHWRRSTASIGHVIEKECKKHFVSTGTALLTAKNSTRVCAVTAKHVLTDLDPRAKESEQIFYLRLPKDSANDDEDLGVKVDLGTIQAPRWRMLPDGSDLALLADLDLNKYFNVHAVGLQDFAEDKDIFQGASILVLGYPSFLNDESLVTPLARGGIVAWLDPINGPRQRFLIDANIFNGNSGGPVFRLNNGLDANGNFSLQSGYKFIGIVTHDVQEPAPIFDKEGNAIGMHGHQTSDEDTQYFALVKNIGGIGYVEPVEKVRKLINDNCD